MNFRSFASPLLVSLVFAGGLIAQTPKPAAKPAATPKPAVSAASAARHAKTRKLLELTGATSAGGQVLDSVIADIRRNVPQVPDAFWKTFRAESQPAAFTDRLIAVYEKQFTEAEVDELNRFYSSPIGKKFVGTQPALAKESMVVARTWAQQIGQRAMQQMAAKGYIQKATKK